MAACKCVLDCHCKKQCKMAAQEQSFLQDQRSLRVMCMSTVNQKTTKKIKQPHKRKADEDVRTEKYRKMADAAITSLTTSLATMTTDQRHSVWGKCLGSLMSGIFSLNVGVLFCIIGCFYKNGFICDKV